MDEETFIRAGIEQGEESAYRRALEGYRAAKAFSHAVCMDCQGPLDKRTEPDNILGEVCPKCAVKAMRKNRIDVKDAPEHTRRNIQEHVKDAPEHTRRNIQEHVKDVPEHARRNKQKYARKYERFLMHETGKQENERSRQQQQSISIDKNENTIQHHVVHHYIEPEPEVSFYIGFGFFF